jgi:hypothetical protein
MDFDVLCADRASHGMWGAPRAVSSRLAHLKFYPKALGPNWNFEVPSKIRLFGVSESEPQIKLTPHRTVITDRPATTGGLNSPRWSCP